MVNSAKPSPTRDVTEVPHVEAMVFTFLHRPAPYLVSRAILSAPVHVIPRKGQRLEIPTKDKIKGSSEPHNKKGKYPPESGAVTDINEKMWCTSAFHIPIQPLVKV